MKFLHIVLMKSLIVSTGLGVSHWNVSFKLTLTDRNMQVRFCLKVTEYSWDLEIWVSLTSFQKINLGWPQQPPPENSVWVFIILSKNIFFKTSKWNYFSPQIIEFKNKDGFEVLHSDFSGLKNLCSLIDLSGLCNLTGFNSLYSPNSSKNFLILMVISSITPKWPIVVIFLWNGLSKITIFTDIWYPFCRRLLRPAYVNF